MTDPAAPASRFSGPAVILGATVIAGVASYLLTWLVPRVIGYAPYASFAVFWSAVYLLVGTLGGIQQEIARATRVLPAEAPRQVNRSRNFALGAAVLVAALIVGTAPFWQGAVFREGGWALVGPLVIAAGGYVVVAVVGGSLYGVSAWTAIAAMVVADAVLRLVLVGVGILVSHDTAVLAWGVAIPFPLVVVALWPLIRRRIVHRTQVDVGYRRLSWNVVRTIAAAAATSLMVSGFPLLVGLTSSGVSAQLVGLVILTATLVRAPLIVVAMSFQSYLVVFYRDHPASWRRVMLGLQAIAILGGAALGALAWWLAPTVFSFLFAGQPAPGGPFVAVLVLSSGLVGAMCVTAPALLARGDHVGYSAGWVVGAVATIAAMLLPFDVITRAVIALCAGPVLGLVVEAGYLVVRRRSAGSSPPAERSSS